MPDDAGQRVQLILGVITFAAVGLGLVLTAFLRVRRWHYNRNQQHDAQVYEAESSTHGLPSFVPTSTDPYTIAQEALKLVDQVSVENAQLKRQLARAEAKNPHGGTLPTQEWIRIVNDAPDLVPHVGIEGATRTGKTTLAEGILHQREGQILIITAKTGDTWGNLPYVTVDNDGSFTTAAATFRALHREVLRRLVATKHHADPGSWLTVVLDDYPALRDACSETDEPFLLIARIGASLRVRLMVLTYSQSVKELGLEGKGDARHHFIWIRRTRHGDQRTATMQWEGLTYDLDTNPIVQLAHRPLNPARAWQPVITSEDFNAAQRPAKRRATTGTGIMSKLIRRSIPNTPADTQATLRQLLAQPTEDSVSVFATIPTEREQNPLNFVTQEQGGIAGITHQEANTTNVRDNTGMNSDTALAVRDLPDEVIRALAAGEQWSANQIARHLYGAKQKRLQRIEQALHNQEEQVDVEAVNVT